MYFSVICSTSFYLLTLNVLFHVFVSFPSVPLQQLFIHFTISFFLFHFQVSSVWFSSLLRCLQSSLFCTVPLVIFDTLNSSCLNAFLPLCVCVCDFDCSCKLTQCTSARPWYYQALTWKDWGREAVSMQCTLCSCTKIYVKCDGSAECAIVSQRITARFKVFHV